MSNEYIDMMKAQGWKVYKRIPQGIFKGEYCYCTDGTNIAYVQWSDGLTNRFHGSQAKHTDRHRISVRRPNHSRLNPQGYVLPCPVMGVGKRRSQRPQIQELGRVPQLQQLQQRIGRSLTHLNGYTG
jgi:hypothetical protein